MQAEAASYFVASKHKLSVFFALIFRFSSCQHPLLASALAKMAQDDSNRSVIGKDEGALRQLLSMMLSDDPHVVGYASPKFSVSLQFCLNVTAFVVVITNLYCYILVYILMHTLC